MYENIWNKNYTHEQVRTNIFSGVPGPEHDQPRAVYCPIFTKQPQCWSICIADIQIILSIGVLSFCALSYTVSYDTAYLIPL